MDLNKVLNIKQFNATNLDKQEEEVLIYGELIDTDKSCPKCKTKAIKPHQYHEKKLRTVPVNDLQTYLLFIHTAYLCEKCGTRFLEGVEFFEPYQRHTVPFENYIWKWGKKQDISRVAELEGLSWNTVNEIFKKNRETEEKQTKQPGKKARKIKFR